MHKRELRKADGRLLALYAARAPLPSGLPAPSAGATPHGANPHLRWHPLRGEWVAYAGHRQHRTFLPPAEYNPLAPAGDAGHPTEVPAGPWDIAVFENMFPTLAMTAATPPALDVPTAPGRGVCEVVVFTQDSTATLGSLPLWHLELLMDVWADRQKTLGSHDEIKYVFPFENRGVEVGVTLHHPHGQIYAFPFVPPAAERELERQREYRQRTGRGLIADMIERELNDGVRLVYQGDHAVAFTPICARYSYEIWVAPRRAAPSFVELTREERADFARALKTVLLKYDGLWKRPFPYVLVFHQAPTDGAEYPEAHLHAEFYPAYRMEGRLKYLAGCELGTGVFTADTVPEETVKHLQAVAVDLHT